MELFLELEGPYLVIGAFILAITAFVTTRDFVPRVAFKRGMLSVILGLGGLVGFHYYMTTTRMSNVEELFKNKEVIICENKMQRTISQSVLIYPDVGWTIVNHVFTNPEYERDFHTSRCVEWIGSEPQLKQAAEEKARKEAQEAKAAKEQQK